MFYSNLNKFNNLNPQKKVQKRRKGTLYDNASEIYNEYLEIYFDEYKVLSDAKKESWVINMVLLIYFLKHIIMIPSLKMKNWLIQQEKLIKNNL